MMAVSWTGLARKYRLVHHNALLPSATLSSIINAKTSTLEKQYLNILTFSNSLNVSPKQNPSNYRNYSCVVCTNRTHGNTRGLSKYAIKRGCQKIPNEFPLVTLKTNFHNSSICKSTRLTPSEATNILRKNEYTTDELWTGSENGNSPVKSFDMNSIRSNNPTEDSHSEAIIRFGSNESNGMLFGIFDGHGGAACGQVIVLQTYRLYIPRSLRVNFLSNIT